MLDPIAADLSAAATVKCPNCGAEINERFCPHCGEERYDHDRLRFFRLVHGAVEEIIDFEHSKLLATFGTLFFRPGQLTAAYLAGARKRYLGPVKLFLFAFATSLLVYSAVPRTAAYDVRAMMTSDSTGTWQKLVKDGAATKKIPVETFIGEINERWRKYLTAAEIIYPLSVAAALWLLYWRRSRFFGEHFIFALHYVAFSLLLAIALWPIYYLSGIELNRFYGIAVAINIFLATFYMVMALRRAYADTWLKAVLRAILVEVAYHLVAGGAAFVTLAVAIILAMR